MISLVWEFVWKLVLLRESASVVLMNVLDKGVRVVLRILESVPRLLSGLSTVRMARLTAVVFLIINWYSLKTAGFNELP